jgi:hypothetical protein
VTGGSVTGGSVTGASVTGDCVEGASVTGGASDASVGGITGEIATVSSDLAATVVSVVVQPLNPKPMSTRPTAVAVRRFLWLRDQSMPWIDLSVSVGSPGVPALQPYPRRRTANRSPS